jgi:pimeloyl-ACP methyl ester carboxylesterase
VGHKLDQTLAVLNGLVGDYLARERNGLATEMACYRDGGRIAVQAQALANAYPNAGSRVALFVHGVMCTESVWRFADGSDYGSKLEAALGITPLYLRYNSGLPIADNGAALADLLEALNAAYPARLEELILVGYSMGGLLLRSACHVATERGQRWLSKVRRAIYVGTPHLGAPAERVGRLVARVLHAIPDPYTRLIGDLSDLRSAGVKDLGDADLRHQDRATLSGRLSLRDPRHPVPLLPDIRHALVAGSLALDPRVAALFGDSIVPIASATDGASIDPQRLALLEGRVRVLPGRSHLDLAHDDEVCAQLECWCREQADG